MATVEEGKGPRKANRGGGELPQPDRAEVRREGDCLRRQTDRRRRAGLLLERDVR